MSNDFYNHGSFPTTGSAATSASMRTELDSIAAGFDKLPTLTGNADEIVVVNASGTALSSIATLPATSGGTGFASYAVGDLLFASTTTALSKLADVATGNALISGGVGVAPSYGKIGISTHVSGLGTSVATALGVNVGTAGAFVVNGGALGTPSSGTLTNATGLPVSTGISGFGTDVATALAVNVGTAGAFVVNGGALGTPSSGTLTNATGLPVGTGISGFGTNVATALAVNVGTAGAFVVNGGALGTPSSGTLTNATGLPLTTGVTGTLPTANGGTNLTSFTANGVVYASSTSALVTGSALTFDGTNFATTGSVTSAGASNSGNLTFTGTGNRITGDFSNATVANRVMFQSSTTNGNTIVSALPNGTATTSGIRAYNNSDLANNSNLIMSIDGTLASIQSQIVGTGTYLPMTFYTGGSEAARIDTSRNVLIGGTAARGTTVGSAHLDLFNGTAPAGTLTNGISLYSLSGDFYFMDALGGQYEVGFRNVPPVGTKTGSYTLAVADVGKYVQVGTGGSITIPDATFAEGDIVSIFNNTTGTITITCTITTAYISGTDADKASVTLATRGVATIFFVSGTVCVITGNVT